MQSVAGYPTTVPRVMHTYLKEGPCGRGARKRIPATRKRGSTWPFAALYEIQVQHLQSSKPWHSWLLHICSCHIIDPLQAGQHPRPEYHPLANLRGAERVPCCHCKIRFERGCWRMGCVVSVRIRAAVVKRQPVFKLTGKLFRSVRIFRRSLHVRCAEVQPCRRTTIPRVDLRSSRFAS